MSAKEILGIIGSVLAGASAGLAILAAGLFVSSSGPFRPMDPLDYVYLLKNDSGAQCTAFATEEEVVYTAAHCIGESMVLIDRYGQEYPAKLLMIDLEGDMAIVLADDRPAGGLQWIEQNTTPKNNSSASVIGFLGGISPVPVIQPVIVAFTARVPHVGGYSYGIFTIGSPVWPGTSGGPLLNADNEVIGIAVAAHTYHFGEKDMIRDLGQFSTIIEFE